MRSMLVIGLGLFGTNLAIRLSELGNEVMAIDRDEEKFYQEGAEEVEEEIEDLKK